MDITSLQYNVAMPSPARFDQRFVRTLVEEKLAEFPGEYNVFAQYQGLPRPDLPFDRYRELAIKEMKQRAATQLALLATPPASNQFPVVSWQYGFSHAPDEASVGRSYSDGLFLKLQAYRYNYITSIKWRACLYALDRPERWLELGQKLEGDGQLVEANAAFAAARWLEPAQADAQVAAILSQRKPDLPRRLLDQPRPRFTDAPFLARHWLAWDMKNYELLDLPSLLAYESDPNFSVRTRIYRSLGQVPHPVSIQTLQEATLDPHPFARAQAIRSLGWLCDPTFIDEIHALANEDPEPDVRRTAAKAIQRIAGFWLYYGQWNAIAQSHQRIIEVMQDLAGKGLAAFALDISALSDTDESDDPVLADLIEKLEPSRLDHDFDSPLSRYTYYFAEARTIDEKPRAGMTQEKARAMARDKTELGWEARRSLRRLGMGSIDERRLHANTWT
jgi:hypothetical protein